MTCNRLKHDDVLRILPQRDPQAHKGSFGKILLLCGSRGFTGAAALAAMGALRSGAGLVYLGVPECIYDIAAVKLTEPVVIPLPDNGKTLSEAAISEIRQLLPADPTETAVQALYSQFCQRFDRTRSRFTLQLRHAAEELAVQPVGDANQMVLEQALDAACSTLLAGKIIALGGTAGSDPES